MIEHIFGERKYFKILFVIYVFSNTLALGYFGITFNPLSLLVLGYGLMILVYQLFQGELLYSKNHLLLMGLYSFLLLIATYMNKSYSTNQSYLIALMQILIILLIFGQPKSMSLKQLKEEWQMIIPLTSVLVGVASLVSLGMYFLNISGARNGWYIGLVGSRLFGVYFNCNPASFLAIIVVLMSLIAIKNHYRGEFFYYINIAIQLSYIVLTQCRAAIIILAVIATAILYYHFFRSKEMSTFKKAILNIGTCICILFSSLIINKVAFIIPQLQGAMVSESSRFQFDDLKEIAVLAMSGDVRNIPKIIDLVDDVSSGRVTLAKNSIKVWKTNPIQGIGAGNFREMLTDITNEEWGAQILHTHNVFMEAFVTNGIFGLSLFCLFCLKTLFTTRDILIKYRNKRSYFIILLMMMMVVSEFIGGFFDFGVFYVYSLSATLAWMFLGYLYWLNDQPDLSLIDDTHAAIFNRYELLSIHYTKEDLDTLEPEFEIKEIALEDDDYTIQVTYFLGQSTFTYNIYYTLKQSRPTKKLTAHLVKDFYTLIQDDMRTIYEQSHIQ